MSSDLIDNIVIWVPSIAGVIICFGLLILLIVSLTKKKSEPFVCAAKGMNKKELIEIEKDILKGNNALTAKNTKKVLKYFGGNYCPHSNKDSKVYKLIKKFEESHPDINVEFYWSGVDDSVNEFKKADAKYVPTITNKDYKKIELVFDCTTLECNEKRASLNNMEREQLLLEEIKNKL